MGGETWLAWTFAIIMIALAVYCLGRLLISSRQHRPSDHQVDALHVLMGVAMAGMLVPRLRVFYAGGWEVVFAIATAWFGWLAIREFRGERTVGGQPGHHLQHVVGSAAMVYMFAAAGSMKTTSGSAMSGMAAGGAAHFPTLALVFAFVLFGYVIWTTDRLNSLAPVAVLARRTRALVGAGGGRMAEAVAVAGGGQSQPQAGDPPAPGAGTPLSPALAACCEIAMGVTMGYMLILML